MTALPDVSSDAITGARWRAGELAFWIIVIACAFLFPSRYWS
jgi:branched-chain amino acid transport system permease protein